MSTAATPVLRDARWTDLTVLARLESALFPDDAWDERSWWAELAARPRRDYVVAEDGDALLGYGGLDHGGEVSDVMTVAVAPAARGRGLGRTLLDELERRASGRGAEHVMLEVRADNDAATGLYGSAGYTVLTTRRGYYQPGAVDALVMRKTLRQNGVGDD
ncbi:ribosomal protein S18-alanine N-acetyltransferase [Phycicoccus sonneratiae]|uniref:Ribosomal protein S18-alanine N-acetyltransferase n=1 Tax=Phycicoccus sonneratiae TaxID=2807628 RepID=A0ABS2CPX9_9MICO|nr:ribosomal protein S18-alanine N-acetyltransferase [Phycicoccus sonneraticus]MBM6401939.1 ribosomal protein S18-alanine N-acetyltransferase [Phycicoccus sonneraticus]